MPVLPPWTGVRAWTCNPPRVVPAPTKTLMYNKNVNYKTPPIISRADNSVKNWGICPIAFQKQITKISMHSKFGENPFFYLLKLSSRTETPDVSRAENSVKNCRILPISNPKPDLHNINAQTKFGGNPLIFIQVIIRKGKYGHVASK